MSEYFILKDERTNPRFDTHIEGILLDNELQIIPNPFNKLETINKLSTYYVKVTEKKSEPGKLRDKLSLKIQNNEALFVVNTKCQQFLKQFCENIELYNLTIKRGAELNEDYKIVNIINSVECVNHKESNLIYWEMSHETVYNIDELVLNEDIIPQRLNIFLLGGVRGTVIVVHKRLKEAIENLRITGFNLCKSKDFVL